MGVMKKCPHCDRDYAPTDGLTVRRTPVGRKIEELIFPVTGWWAAIFLTGVLIFAITYHPPPGSTVERGFGWFIIFVPLIPGGIMAIISWFFPMVRIYRCRHCGQTHEVLLKIDELPSAESSRR